MNFRSLGAFILLSSPLWSGPPAPANHQKLSSALQQLSSSEQRVNVIVQYASTPSEKDHSAFTAQGGSIMARYRRLKFGSYAVPANRLAGLAQNGNIKHISLDRPVSAKLDYSAAAVNAGTAWLSGLDGSGIGVAVIDSGVTPVADLGKRVVYSQDFVGGDGTDQYGHGEHVSGIIASSGVSSTGPDDTHTFRGIAPNANIVNLRVLDQSGAGTDTSVIAAIDQAIALQSTYNIRVINLSVGRPVFESYTDDPLCQAVEQAWQAGIVVVVAAGNDGRVNTEGTNGYGTINSPGNDPYVITVGAMKTMGTYDRGDDLIASYSSKGPSYLDHIVKPDIVAPGNLVVSLLAPGTPTLAAEYPQNAVPLSYYLDTAGSGTSANYMLLSGTSMATPVVSGAAADLLQAHPSLTPDQV
jgi:serine protease AprX